MKKQLRMQRKGELVWAWLKPVIAAVFVLSPVPPLEAGNEVVDIALTGRIAPTCTLAARNFHADIGTIKQVGAVSVSFVLSCNSSFRVSLAAQNGGLLNGAAPSVPPPFATRVPYSLSLKLAGGNVVLIDMCSSDHRTDGAASCLGYGGATVSNSSQDATLGISWNLRGLVPLAGAYQDIVTLTVTPGL